MDPPREEVKAAVAECRAAGIRPVMVTGDHKATGPGHRPRRSASPGDGDRAVDGAELERMPEQDCGTALDRIAVFARVHPAQKLRIVEAFQSRGEVVAMTGDGVNDAPALARADVGVAMGITGTEVAKSAAKIVITDDNFATIVNAVEQGRLVYGNLKKVMLFLFATSMDEVIVLLLALVLRLSAAAGRRADPLDQHRHRRHADGEPGDGGARRRRDAARRPCRAANRWSRAPCCGAWR